MSGVYANFLREKGIHLNLIGLNEIALTRVDALHAVDLLKEDSIPVLGGDVYFRLDKKIELAFANWYSNHTPGEAHDDFLARSLQRTLSYIKNFPDKIGREPLFTLVLMKEKKGSE